MSMARIGWIVGLSGGSCRGHKIGLVALGSVADSDVALNRD
jgi:hypothetical protein